MTSARDFSGNGYNAFYEGLVEQVSAADAAVVGDIARRFSDSGRTLADATLQAALGVPAPCSMEFWYRADQLGNYYQTPLMARIGVATEDLPATGTEGFNFYVQDYTDSSARGPGQFAFWVGGPFSGNGVTVGDWNVLSSGVVPTVGVWHHLVGTINAAETTAKLYVDGTLRKSQTITGYNVHATDYPLQIGRSPANVFGSDPAQVTGSIDEVAILQVEMSAADVAARYALRGDADAYYDDVMADNPLAYWRLNDVERGGFYVGQVQIG